MTYLVRAYIGASTIEWGELDGTTVARLMDLMDEEPKIFVNGQPSTLRIDIQGTDIE